MQIEKCCFLENCLVELWIENGIIYEVFKPGTILQLDDAKKVVSDRLKVSSGITMPMYVDIRHLVKVDKSALNYMSSGEATSYLSAGAFIMDNVFNTLMFNTFTKFHKPAIPAKSFSDKDKALLWLEKFKQIKLSESDSP